MTLEAKKAAKLEKKLKILLGGYQVEPCFFFIAFGDVEVAHLVGSNI